MEGRGRSRRDYPSRSEEKSRSDRGNNPPSRHLWVGNISHSLTERAFVNHFMNFGELESVAFQPGRSYAFVNYRSEEDAFAAIKELQGFAIGGNPLRIEFAKAEKSLVSARDVHYSERRDDYSKARGSPVSQRDTREHRLSPEPHLKKSRMNDRDAEPSEVLWIGFPAQLRVDDFVLRKAFAPFGDIEKITTFPGRTYAFVRFRKVMSATRAKETLQGKLLGNPRVHICFAKSDSGTSNRDRNAPPSPRSSERTGSFEHFHHDRNYGIMSDDPDARPYSNLDHGEPNMIGQARDTNLWSGGNDALEERRYLGQGSKLRLPGNVYEHPDSPPRNFGARIREFSPHNYSRQGAMYDDPWDLPEDVSLLQGTKKLKTSTFPSENDLPEYPFSDLEKAKHIHPHDIPQSALFDKMYDSRNSGYRPIPERLANMAPNRPLGERDDHWNALHDDFQAGSMPMLPIDRRRLTPDLRGSSSKEVWKWEGMIAKGGNPICRVRCLPVGKPPDMVLPEHLDCTARTTLDMLSKHYYQAASAWVVFFVPANDRDISYYNEFMNYLGERQRAAVAKLDEMTTLFLVPPSDFSNNVLKVPGKLSISGVVLRLDAPGSSFGNREALHAPFQGELGYQNPISPSGHYLPLPPFANDERAADFPATGNSHSMQPGLAQGNDYARRPSSGPNWSSHDTQSSNPVAKTNAPPPSKPPAHISSMDQPYTSMPRNMQEPSHSNYTPDNVPLGGSKFVPPENPPNPSSTHFANLPPEQVAQLASSVLGQQGQLQLAGMPSNGEYAPPGFGNESGYSYNMPPNYELPNDQVTSEWCLPNEQVCSDFPPPQFGQSQQQQQPQQQLPLPPPPPQNLATPRPDALAAPQMNNQDDTESDPQKRLQATLQLAAALLQQIQQGKGT